MPTQSLALPNALSCTAVAEWLHQWLQVSDRPKLTRAEAARPPLIYRGSLIAMARRGGHFRAVIEQLCQVEIELLKQTHPLFRVNILAPNPIVFITQKQNAPK